MPLLLLISSLHAIILTIGVALLLLLGWLYGVFGRIRRSKISYKGKQAFTLKFRLSFPGADGKYAESADVEMTVPGDNYAHAVTNLKNYVREKGQIVLRYDDLKIILPLIPASL